MSAKTAPSAADRKSCDMLLRMARGEHLTITRTAHSDNYHFHWGSALFAEHADRKAYFRLKNLGLLEVDEKSFHEAEMKEPGSGRVIVTLNLHGTWVAAGVRLARGE